MSVVSLRFYCTLPCMLFFFFLSLAAFRTRNNKIQNNRLNKNEKKGSYRCSFSSNEINTYINK